MKTSISLFEDKSKFYVVSKRMISRFNQETNIDPFTDGRSLFEPVEVTRG